MRVVLNELGLGFAASHKLRQLSGGQQQLVSLATATVHKPPVLLLDEPTTGLDPQARRSFWNRIKSIRDSGCAVLVTTHSMEEAQSVCDRIAIIDHGTIVAMGTPDELIEDYGQDEAVRRISGGGSVKLEDIFIGLTEREITRDKLSAD